MVNSSLLGRSPAANNSSAVVGGEVADAATDATVTATAIGAAGVDDAGTVAADDDAVEPAVERGAGGAVAAACAVAVDGAGAVVNAPAPDDVVDVYSGVGAEVEYTKEWSRKHVREAVEEQP